MAMRLPRLWRRWVAVVAVILVLAVAATLVVGTVTGPGAWTRVTSVTESPSTVTITVSSLLVQLGPGAAVGVPAKSTVDAG